MEKENVKKGNEIKSTKLYDFVCYGVFRIKDKLELSFIECRKNEWNLENEIVKKYNKGLSKNCIGLIMRLEKGSIIKNEMEVGNRIINFDDWECKVKSNYFKGFRMCNVVGGEDGEKTILGDLFNDLDKYVEWVNRSGYLEVKKIKGVKNYEWIEVNK